MTSASYIDKDGSKAVLEEFYKIPKDTLENRNCMFSMIGSVYEKEKDIINHIEKNGGKLLSIISTPISKRRYKRKMAKMVKRNQKIISALEQD